MRTGRQAARVKVECLSRMRHLQIREIFSQSAVPSFYQAYHLKSTHVHLPRFSDKGVDTLGENPHSLFERERRARGGNVGAGGAPLLNNPGNLQLAIGPGDSVRVDEELFGEGANWRQLFAG